MTSLSVRQYLVGIYRELGLKEQNVKKVQTGSVALADVAEIVSAEIGG